MDSDPGVYRSLRSYQYIRRLLKGEKEKEHSFPIIARLLGNEEKNLETTIHSLKLLVKLHPGDTMLSTKIAEMYSPSCGVYEKQA